MSQGYTAEVTITTLLGVARCNRLRLAVFSLNGTCGKATEVYRLLSHELSLSNRAVAIPDGRVLLPLEQSPTGGVAVVGASNGYAGIQTIVRLQDKDGINTKCYAAAFHEKSSTVYAFAPYTASLYAFKLPTTLENEAV